jgi:TolB-like protein
VISGFLRELKRRRVLRTALLYVVGSWIALQVAEVLSEAGLPPSAMRNLLIILSFGLPLALIIGWFFDITMEGARKTGPLGEGEMLPELKFIDHVLLVGLILVVTADAYILSLPPPEDASVEVTASSQQRTIAVLAFDDLDLTAGSDPIGDAFAGELRSSLTRTAGLRVLGPETSKMLHMAGENTYVMAKELYVTALLLGDVMLDGSRIRVNVRLIGVPAGNELWSSSMNSSVGDAVSLQQRLIKQVVGAAAPNLDPDPVQGPRAKAGDCSEVYDVYLRGKQLTKDSGLVSDARKRGLEMLREAVAVDDQCALAWQAIAEASVNWTMSGFAKAGAAARRALELNDTLPGAWRVLAEIAEEERRWTDSEEYFLRALYADPTNAPANEMYGETLLARGRVKEGLHYVLEAYRYEPASRNINWHVSFAAKMAGDADLVLKHTYIFADLDPRGRMHPWAIDQLAEGFLIKGETELALEQYLLLGVNHADWFAECVRAREDQNMLVSAADGVRETLKQLKAGKMNDPHDVSLAWQVIRCSTWIGEADIVFDLLLGEGVPTEGRFFALFHADAGVLRQHPRFRKLVVESRLLDYWRKWGWSDYCEPDGESFRCN